MPEGTLDLFSSQISTVTCLLWSRRQRNLARNSYFLFDQTESGFLFGIPGVAAWELLCPHWLKPEVPVGYHDLLVQFGHRVLCGFLQLQELGLLIQLLLELIDLCFQLLEPFPAPLAQPGKKQQQILFSFRDTS